MSNPFWEYSLFSYSREGVSQVCLKLQDERGIDVNILLYSAWLASLGKQLTTGHLQALEGIVEPWRERVVIPLRDLRRQLHSYSPAGELRQRIKQLELDAEREQQDLMWACYRDSAPLPDAPGPLAGNLLQVLRRAAATPGVVEKDLARLQALLEP